MTYGGFGYPGVFGAYPFGGKGYPFGGKGYPFSKGGTTGFALPNTTVATTPFF